MVISECKSGFREIERSDVAHLERVSARVRESGIECHIALAVTRPEFNETEREIIGDLVGRFAAEEFIDPDAAGRQRCPILLTSDTLDFFQRYEPARDGQPIEHPTIVADLATNTTAMHFGNAPYVPIDRSTSQLGI